MSAVLLIPAVLFYYDRGAIATLTAERDAARDEAARLRAELAAARADKELYYDMFCAEMARRANGLK